MPPRSPGPARATVFKPRPLPKSLFFCAERTNTPRNGPDGSFRFPHITCICLGFHRLSYATLVQQCEGVEKQHSWGGGDAVEARCIHRRLCRPAAGNAKIMHPCSRESILQLHINRGFSLYGSLARAGFVSIRKPPCRA